MKSKIVKSLMKKNSLWLVVCVFFTLTTVAQIKEVTTDIFSVVYDEGLEQPIKLSYRVQCPLGDASRSGLDFRKYEGVHTSDNGDYSNNVYDKGHLAPAAAFNCDREMVRSTFSYLNCALQHEGLNRGPWKELERFERDLAKVYFPDNIHVEVEILFQEEVWLPSGVLVPSGFKKTIKTPENEWTFVFPNKDVAGQDWIDFRTN